MTAAPYVPLKPLGEMLRDQARATPDAGAVWFEGRTTSYAALDRQVDQVANALAALGSPLATRVAFLGKNSDRYIQLLLGAARVGLVTAPLNWRLAPPELVFVINDSEAELLVVGADFVDVVHEIRPQLERVKTIIAMDGGVSEWPAFDAWRDAQAPSPPAHVANLDDVVLQLYTSGTTGLPKGAMLTSGSLMAVRDPAHGEPPAWNASDCDDSSLVAMPAFHVAGTGSAIGGICSGSGALTVLLREFNPDAVFDLLERDALTKMFLVPAALHILVNHPRAREVRAPRMRFIFYGASPMPVELLKTCMEVFQGAAFVQVYGLTEVSGYVCALAPEDHLSEDSTLLRSAGRPMAGTEIRIVDEAGQPLPSRQVGEVLMRTAATMAGYWRRPNATASTIQADGWLRTGDAGFVDENGYVFIQDRIKDMIISGGENVYPAEVENAIFGCPGVADVAVVGVPDERWGEAVKAIVVKAADARNLSPADVIAWTRRRIAGYKTPKSVDFIDALPRNGSGKVLRRVLREPYWQGIERRVN